MDRVSSIKIAAAVLIFILIHALIGCASGPKRDIYSAESVARDRQGAMEANQRGLDALQKEDMEKAEQLLTEAVRLDITLAASHNNLGALYLMTDRYYQAAWEFEYAIKLVPGDPRPRNNLGLVLERVGRLSEAVAHYDAAVDAEPDNPEFVGNLARVLSKANDDSGRLEDLLDHLRLIETRPEWRSWAEKERVRVR